jgi:type I restriction enzyme S subunit
MNTGDWELTRIDQVGRVVTGKTPSSERPEEFGGRYPFITPSDIPATQKHVRVERHLSERGMDAHKRIQLPEKSICVVCIGATIGKVCMTRQPSLSNQQINSIISKKGKYDPDFVYYLSTTLRDSLVAFAGGAATPIINKSTFSSIKLFVPEFNAQRKIGALLSAYDELFENNRRRIALLEKLAEEIYREWFVRLRFPGYETVKVVKGVPSGWEVRTLGSFASEIKRGVKKKDLADDEKYIGLEHIPRRSIALKEWATADSVESNKLLFQERDILFGKIRPYLHKVALAHFSGACSSDTIVIRPKEKCYEGYLLFTVFSDTFIELASIASKGTKMPRADWGFLKKLELPIPDERLLEIYQAQFEAVFSQIVNLLQTNELLTKSRDLLLPRLMSGKLSVENLNVKFPPGMKEQLDTKSPGTAHA